MSKFSWITVNGVLSFLKVGIKYYKFVSGQNYRFANVLTQSAFKKLYKFYKTCTSTCT